MRRLLLPGLVVAFVIAIMLVPATALGVSIPAAPYASANDCLACHQAGNSGPVVHNVDFNVPPVDKTRCSVCHGIASHPPHGFGGDCASCHASWPTTGISLPYQSTFYAGASGYFSGPNSVAADGPTLHAIHGKRQWPADVTSRSLGCNKCHGAVTCTACHGPVAHDSHPTQNGNPAPQAPIVSASPLPSGAFGPDYFTTVSCASANCHAGIGTERITEDTDPSVTADANWTRATFANSGMDFLADSALNASQPDAVLSVPFVGNQVSIWGVSGSICGAMDIYIDGKFVAHKELFEGGLHLRNGVFQSGDVGPGSHILRIVTAASAVNGSTQVYFDRIVSRDLVAPTNTTPQCTTCHPDKSNEHGYNTIDHVADETTTVDPTLGKPCGSCHSMDLQAAHAAVSVPNGSGAPITGCAICHSVLPGETLTAEGTINSDHLPQSPSRWDQTCEACHAASNPLLGANKHLDQAMHTLSGTALTNSQKCFTCHPKGSPGVVDLPTMHASADVTVSVGGTPTHLSACDVCHKNPTLPRDGNGLLSNDCTVCHFQFGDHPKDHGSTYNLSSCDNPGCHTASVTPVGSNATTEDLVAIHNEKAAGGTFDCNGCHASADTKVQNAIAAGNTNCDACHTLGAGGGANDPHYVLHWANPALADGLPATPHYAYVTGSASGGAFTTDCLGCHTSNVVDEHLGVQASNGSWSRLPRHDVSGAGLTCATCHASGRLQVLQAIQAGKTNCDACHVVHKQIPAQHVTSFKPNPELKCTDCHAGDLTVIHNGGLVATTGNGTRLTGCSLCHDYTTNLDSTDDTMGARVQAAITAGDPNNYCAGCHLGYHQNQDAEHLSPTTSTCFGAGCHAVSKSLPDVHALYVGPGSSNPGYSTTCQLCHENKDPNRIDWSKATAQCTGVCHDVTTHSSMSAGHALTSESNDCVGCHGSQGIVVIHKANPNVGGSYDKCATCHNNPSRGGDLTANKTNADCKQCHTTSGSDFHRSQDASHTFTTMPSTCVQSGCHPSNKLPDVHASYVGTSRANPQYATSCALCHQNANASRIDWTKASADCSSCHTPVDPSSPHTSSHTTSSPSSGCFGCHSGDVFGIHQGRAEGKCAVCHANPTKGDLTAGKTSADCAGCHAGYDATTGTGHTGLPADHNSSTITSSCTGTGCHAVALPATHDAYAAKNGFATSCEMCHENPTRIPDITQKTAACNSCHGLGPNGHVGVHVATETVTVGCEGCHTIPSGGDIASLHVSAKYGPCNTCHNNPDKGGDLTMSGGVRKPNAACTQSGCHSDKTPYDPNHYPAPKHADSQASQAYEGTTCSLCHSMDLKAEHITKTTSTMPDGSAITCVKCHASAKFASLPDTTTVASIAAVWNSTCEQCHTTKHSSETTLHASPTITAACQGAGCHNPDLPTTHAAYVAKNGFTTSCAMCHANPTRIPDITKKNAACSSCHAPVTPPGHVGVHVATETVTVGCEGCHTIPSGGDIASLHVSAKYGPCNTCHNNPDKGGDLTMSGGVRKPNAACTQSGCHADKTPYDPNHYPAPKHAANESLTVDPSIGTACGQCHYMDLKAEHITKTTSTMPDGTAITCVKCHASAKFASLPDTTTVASIAAVWSPQTCEKCHTVKHDQMAAKHNFSTIRPECGGTGCHAVSDLASIHTSATVTVGGKTLTRCAVCHQSPTTVPARDCLTCHVGATPGHKGEHEATTTVLPAAQGGGTFGGSGCTGCHYSNLIDEHITSGLKGSAGTTLTCDTCHGSTNAAVKTAIATGDVSCDACHPGVNNLNQHQNQWANEFNSATSSTHRVNASLPGMRSSFVINGTTYTWSLPTSTWLKTPLTTNSIVTCRDCHTFSGTAKGPHGASVAVNIDPSYPGDYHTASLGRSSTSIICDKCHVNYTSMNKVHGEGDHSGEACTNCHSNLPHGWRLPRLLAYTTDPAPYNSNKLNAISLKNHSASSSWSEGDCAANCEDHGGSLSSKWPSVAQTVATVNGTVMDSANATGLAGAVVTLSNGQSTTTLKGGGYRLSNLAAGTYTVSVTATGFIGQSASVTIVSSVDYFANFNLLRQGTIGGTVTDSASKAALSGVTVTMNGRSIVTTGSGKFDFGSQAAGSYSVTYALSGYSGQTKTFTVSDGAATDASVALAKIMYGTVKGKITDKATGAGIASATVGCSLDGTTTTASDGTYTLSNVLYGSGTVTVIASSYDSTTVACVVNTSTVTVNAALTKSVPQTQNIALGDPATASGSSGSSNGPSKAVDGNATTYWNSGSVGSSAEWLQIDLGTSPGVYNKFVIDWDGSYYAKSVNVQTSTDGTNWTTVASTTSGTGGSAQTFTLTNGTNARYVRLSLSNYSTSSGYRIDEFQVWSGGTLPPPAGTVTGKITGGSSAISGATVSISGQGSTTTNSSGTYTCSNLPPGSYTLSVSASGYRSSTTNFTITAGQTTTVNVSLSKSD